MKTYFSSRTQVWSVLDSICLDSFQPNIHFELEDKSNASCRSEVVWKVSSELSANKKISNSIT
jgi:hypothetical protein